MAKRSEVFAPISLALTLGCGLLQAQPAAPAVRPAESPRAQIEAQPAPPVLLQPGSLAGMNLDFTKGARLAEVFLSLGKHAGVSIILHASASAQDLSTSADLRGMGFQRALDTLMLQNDLFYKVLDPTSIMVFKKTPQNLMEFEARAIKTFYLTNAEVGSVRQTCNALMPQLRVFIDKRLNALTVSGTASELAKAQQIVNNLDQARGELRLRMELVEVPRKGPEGAGKVLASPDLRVASGETGEITIGRRLASTPVAVAGKAAKGAAAPKAEDPGPSSPAEDLGVRIKVRPLLRPDHEISLDLEVEITDPLAPSEPGRPGLNARGIRTTLRLKDGETAVFAGLMGDDQGASGGREPKDRVLRVKVVVVRWGDPLQSGPAPTAATS